MTLSALLDPAILAAHLLAARARSNHVTADLQDKQLLGPRLSIVNPPLWEIGHVAWFQEQWCLRHRKTGAPAASLLPGADALYDSAKVPHASRWGLPLPDLANTRAYQANVLERVLHRLEREPENDMLYYFVQLAVFHEDMHSEAFHYTRQTLGYSDPFAMTAAASRPETAVLPAPDGDAELAGGTFALGASASDGFVFDNEKWAHDVHIAPFRMARTPVTNEQYARFVAAGGYQRRDWWSDAGWTWRSATGLQAPRYWIRQGERYTDKWMQRRFDGVAPLAPDEPVIHVNWHEAQAYCRYAQRRLPSEAEWEYAAAADAATEKKRRYPWGDAPPSDARANLENSVLAAAGAHATGDTPSGCRQMLGNVWEWTSSAFNPYPGFVADPYQEYSQPWFGTHHVLRGGSFSTTRRLMRNTWRNFYTPERSDIFAGFRTCAMEVD